MNLAKLIEFCERNKVDTTKVYFDYGHKEVYACFSDEDWKRMIPQEEDFDDEDAYSDAKEEFWTVNDVYYGEANNSISI